MTASAANLRSWGKGIVSVAPSGSTAPTDATTALDTAFKDVGWLDDAVGLTQQRQRNSKDIKGWNAGAIVRTLKDDPGPTFKFQCLETNAIVLGLKYPGSTVTTVSGLTHTAVTAYTGRDLRAWVIDLLDGSIHLRKYIAIGEVIADGDLVFKDEEISVYEFTVRAFPSSTGLFFDQWTDDPAAAVS